MGICDPTAKDVFAAKSQSQNFARLLGRIVQHVFSLLNNQRLFRSANNVWTVSSVPGSVEVDVVDRADIRLCFWQSIRECRELILKGLVLIYFLEQTGYQKNVDFTIEAISQLLDGRESLRKRCLEFSTIQWAPIGFAEPPEPPYAVEVAMDVLFGGGTYPRLPSMMEQCIKQVGEPDPATALQFYGNEKSHYQNRIEDEIFAMWALSTCPKTDAILQLDHGKIRFHVPYEFKVTAIFDLQKCQIINAEILVGGICGLETSPLLNIGFRNILCQGIGLIEARHQFTVEKIKRAVRQTWRKIVALRRRRRELDSSSSSSSFSNSMTDITDTVTDKPFDLSLHTQPSFSSNQEILDIHNKDVNVSLEPTIPVSSDDIKQQIDGKLLDLEKQAKTLEDALRDTLLFESGLGDFIKNESSLTSRRCYEQQLVNSPPDYFAELFFMGRWVCGTMILAILRDQILRAKHFPSIFPGGVFRYAEHGAKMLSLSAKKPDKTMSTIHEITPLHHPTSVPETTIPLSSDHSILHQNDNLLSNIVESTNIMNTPIIKSDYLSDTQFRALDIYLLAQYDFTCGGLLNPLLEFLFHHSSIHPWNQHLTSMLSGDTILSARPYGSEDIIPSSQGPYLEQMSSLTSNETTNKKYSTLDTSSPALPTIESQCTTLLRLGGSGGILRLSLDASKGLWTTVLWPLTPIEWVFRFINDMTIMNKNSEFIDIEQYHDFNKKISQELLFNWTLVQDAIQNDPSWIVIQRFDAKRLELSSWTRHAVACLTTLNLSTIAAYLQNISSLSIYTADVVLRTGQSYTGIPIPSDLSGHRSLRFCYFNNHSIELQIHPFDGSLRITFRTVLSDYTNKSLDPICEDANDASSHLTSSWVRLASHGDSPMDAEIAAAFESCPAGFTGFIKLLPYLKFMSFLAQLRHAFKRYSFDEAQMNYDQSQVLFNLSHNLSSQMEHSSSEYTTLTENRLLASHHIKDDDDCMKNKSFHLIPNELSNNNNDKQSPTVSILTPFEAVELTRTFQKLQHDMPTVTMSTYNNESFLQTYLTFSLDKQGFTNNKTVQLFLRILIKNTFEIISSRVIITRQNDSGHISSTVANLALFHPIFKISDGIGFDTHKQFHLYVQQIQDSLKNMTDRLRHVIAIGKLTTKTFPFYVRSLEEPKENEEFAFTCSPLQMATSSLKSLFWQLTRCILPNEIKQHYRWFTNHQVYITRKTLPLSLNNKGPCSPITITKAILKQQGGIRLPAFYFNQHDYQKGLTFKHLLLLITPSINISVIDIKPILNTASINSEQINVNTSTWCSCSSIELSVETTSTSTDNTSEHTHDDLSNSYEIIFSNLRLIGFFFMGCRQLQRLALIRKDILINEAIPTRLNATWIPWQFQTSTVLSFNSHVSGNKLSNTGLQLPPIHFIWEPFNISNSNEINAQKQSTLSSVIFNSSMITLTISSVILTPILLNSRQKIEQMLKDGVSPWCLIRFIIATFELHASVSCVTQSLHHFNADVPPLPSIISHTKLWPTSAMWVRGSGSCLGKEELIFNVQAPQGSPPPPVPRIVDKITVTFDLFSGKLHKHTGNLSGYTECLSETALPVGGGLSEIPTMLYLNFSGAISTSSAFQTAANVLGRSLNEAFSRFSEGFGFAVQACAGEPTSRTLCGSLVGLHLPDEIKIDPTSDSDTNTAGAATSAHPIYIYPTRLLANFLIPLLNSTVVWLNAITAAASVNLRSTVARTGTLVLSKSASSPEMTTKSTPSGKGVSVGLVRWKHSTIGAEINSSGRTGNNENNLLGAQTSKTSVIDNNQHSLYHALELLLLPVLSNVVYPKTETEYRRCHKESRDPLFSGLAPVASCGGLTSSGLYHHTVRYSHWENIKYYTYNLLSVSDTALLKDYYLTLHDWVWIREFNVLSLPVFFYPMDINDSDEIQTIPPYKLITGSVLQQWRSAYLTRISTKETNTAGQKKKNISQNIEDYAQINADFTYLDLCPESLVLPYELSLPGLSDTIHITLPIENHKVARQVTDKSTMLTRKRHRSWDIQESSSSLDTSITKKHRSGNTENNAIYNNTSTSVLGNNIISEKEIVYSEESFITMQQKLEDILNMLQLNYSWNPPIKPHTALRADGRELELQFECVMELRTLPAMTEWTVIARYFKMYSQQVAVTDFPLLVRFFQRSPSPIAAVGDLSAILDLANTTCDIHTEHFEKVTKWGTDDTAALIPTEFPSLPLIPFIQLEFKKPPVSRQGLSPLLDVEVTVWKCRPTLQRDVIILLQNNFKNKSLDSKQFKILYQNLLSLIAPIYFTFIISIPLPTTDIRQVIINGQFDLPTILEQISHMATKTCNSGGSLSLSLQRPLSKGLAKLFSPSYPYHLLSSLFLSLHSRPEAGGGSIVRSMQIEVPSPSLG